jgi:hypothetical protein
MISPELLASLLVGSVLALSIPGGNRGIGIVATSIITYFYPVPMLIVVLFGVGTYFYRKVFSK